MNYGKVEERSSSRSRSPNTARFVATSAIPTVTLLRWDRAPTSRTADARPGKSILIVRTLRTAMLVTRDSYAPAPESRGLGMHLDRHGKLDGIQSGRRHRSSQPHSRNPKCAVARAAQRVGAGQRRKGYLERVRHRGPPHLRGAHRLDAAGGDHAGERRGGAI